MYTKNELIDIVTKLGADHTAFIDVDKIPFNNCFRKICESNSCGKYNKTWMCPPAAGDIEDLMNKAKKYSYALIFQTISSIEDSFDIEGMLEAGNKHKEISYKLHELLKKDYPDALNLSSGSCNLCKKCAYLEQKPCRFPEKALTSMEVYGIDVYNLSKKCNMKYINGQDTVTYFGAVFFNNNNEKV